jgi:hypothetical protein
MALIADSFPTEKQGFVYGNIVTMWGVCIYYTYNIIINYLIFRLDLC